MGELRALEVPTASQGAPWLRLAEGARLGFGAAAIGNLYSAVDDNVAEAAVHEALVRGISFFDTAPLYGYGLSEARLGRALRGAPRETFALSTKVGRVLADHSRLPAHGPDLFAVNAARHAVFDYTRDGVLRSFESSLERLQMQHVDVLLLHDIGRATHGERHEELLRLALNEALPAMAELKASGSCRAIGLGVNEEAVCLEVMPHFDLDCILLAGRYTLLEQTCMDGVLAEAQRRSIRVVAAAPFNSGLLSHARYPGDTYNYEAVDAETRERAQRLYDVCQREGVDVGAAALQFPLAHPAVAGVVCGLRSPQEVSAAAERVRTPIPVEVWRQLRREGLIAPAAPTPAS